MTPIGAQKKFQGGICYDVHFHIPTVVHFILTATLLTLHRILMAHN